MPLRWKIKKHAQLFCPFIIATFLCSFFTSTTAHSELKLDSVYPTLGKMGEELDVTLTGTGFIDGETRVSMYLDAANQRKLLGSVTTGISYGVAVLGDYAYVADGDSGLHVFDITSGTIPQYTGGTDTPGSARAVAVSGGYAYVAD